MLASTEKEFCINPFQALIETISAREILEKQLEQETKSWLFKDTRPRKLHHRTCLRR